MKIQYILLLAVAFACSRKEDMPSPAEGDARFVTVSLAPAGEAVVDAGQEPLVRADAVSNDLYWAQVSEIGKGNYAYGVFDSPDSMVLKLEESAKYNIRVGLIKDGKNKLYCFPDETYGEPITNNRPGRMPVTNRFVLSRDIMVTPGLAVVKTGAESWETTSFADVDRYYGQVEYTATTTGKLLVDMYRVVWGYRLEVNPFKTGKLSVSFGRFYAGYVFEASAVKQVRDSTMQWGFAYNFDYLNIPQPLTDNVSLTVYWTSDDESITLPVYNGVIDVQRLKRNIIRVNLTTIDLENATASADITFEDVPIGDSDFVYEFGPDGVTFSGTMLDYLRETNTWGQQSLEMQLIEHAGLSELFSGKDAASPRFTYVRLTEGYIFQWMEENGYVALEKVPVEKCRELVKLRILPYFAWKDIPEGKFNEAGFVEGGLQYEFQGRKLWIYHEIVNEFIYYPRTYREGDEKPRSLAINGATSMGYLISIY